MQIENSQALPGTLNQTPKLSSSKKSSTSRKKWKKPEGMPKRPLSAYNLFFAQERQRILQAAPQKGVGFANLARTVAAKWKNLSDADKQPFMEIAAINKLRYKQQVAAWRALGKDQSKKQSKKEKVVNAAMESMQPKTSKSKNTPVVSPTLEPPCNAADTKSIIEPIAITYNDQAVEDFDLSLFDGFDLDMETSLSENQKSSSDLTFDFENNDGALSGPELMVNDIFFPYEQEQQVVTAPRSGMQKMIWSEPMPILSDADASKICNSKMSSMSSSNNSAGCFWKAAAGPSQVDYKMLSSKLYRKLNGSLDYDEVGLLQKIARSA